MSNKLTPMIIEVTPVKECIMRRRIHHSLGVVSLVSVYSPTEASDLTVRALSDLDILASVWQRIKMYVKRWRTLNF